MPNNEDGWQEWSKYVLKELERLNSCYMSIDERLRRIEKNDAVLTAKLAGLCVVVASIVSIIIKSINLF